jgi:hypothetical protein
MRPSLAAFLLFFAACASSPRELDPVWSGTAPEKRTGDWQSDDADPEQPLRRREGMPFIKLADRQMALVVYFAGTELAPGHQEDIERKIAHRLRTTYRTDVKAYRRDGSYIRFAPDLALELAEKGIDDVVIVEVAKDGGELYGHIRVLALFDERVVHEDELALEHKEGTTPPAARFADRVWLSIAKSFVDPGASPELDLQRVADRLASNGACREALKLYKRTLDNRSTTIAETQRREASRERAADCRHRIAVEEEIERDRTATFSVSLVVEDLAPRLEEAVRTAFARGRLERALRAETDKPAVLKVTPAGWLMSMRYQPSRYHPAVAERPREVSTERALYLDVFYPVLAAVSEIREEAADNAVSSEAEMLRELPMTLRLTKPGGDSAAIDFATLDDRVLLTDTIRVKLGTAPEIQAETEGKLLLREGVFVLGAPTDASGGTTSYGLVYRFFELEP